MRSLLLPLLVALVAAVSSSGTTACASDPDELEDPDVAPATVNPDGLPYPSDNLGGRKRVGQRRGDRMPNLAFRGYRDPSKGAGPLESVSLADFYDPEQKRNKVLHVQVAATWCGICSGVAGATASVAPDLRGRGVVFLQVVVSGDTPAKGPSQSELDAWVARHRLNVPTAADVRGRRLAGVGVSAAVVPHDILIDTRTMEILDSSVGAPLDVTRYVEDGLRFANQSAPSY